jgi:hypothetical protein
VKKHLIILAVSTLMATAPIISKAESQLISSDVKTTSYISEILVELKSSEVKTGVETFKKKDGSCYQVEYILHEIRKEEGASGTIELPVTSISEKAITCPKAG